MVEIFRSKHIPEKRRADLRRMIQETLSQDGDVFMGA